MAGGGLADREADPEPDLPDSHEEAGKHRIKIAEGLGIRLPERMAGCECGGPKARGQENNEAVENSGSSEVSELRTAVRSGGFTKHPNRGCHDRLTYANLLSIQSRQVPR